MCSFVFGTQSGKHAVHASQLCRFHLRHGQMQPKTKCSKTEEALGLEIKAEAGEGPKAEWRQGGSAAADK